MQFSFQTRVYDWLVECFGNRIADSKRERNQRFLEEALELVQACGMTRGDAQAILNDVFDNKQPGEINQEIGGVMVCLAALCRVQKANMEICGEAELQRIWPLMDKIRTKHAAKSPLVTDIV